MAGGEAELSEVEAGLVSSGRVVGPLELMLSFTIGVAFVIGIPADSKEVDATGI